MSRIVENCAIFKDIMGMHTEEDKALAIHDVMEMPTHNGFTKAEMLNVIKWLWHQKYRLDDEPITNADRIRNMTDEELANYLVLIQKIAIERGRADSEKSSLEILQAEVKEGE